MGPRHRGSPVPLISVRTSCPVPADPGPLLQQLSARLAELLGKPERYVMTLLETGVPMTFAGDPAPACYVEIKSIGALDGDRPRQISAALCELLVAQLGVGADRIYIGFEDVAARLWGWDGGTFG